MMKRPGSLAVFLLLASLLFLQTQYLTKVICLKESGPGRIESSVITGRCTCNHAPATMPSMDHFPAIHACRDFSLASLFQVVPPPLMATPLLLPAGIVFIAPTPALHWAGLSSPFPAPIPPGATAPALSLRC